MNRREWLLASLGVTQLSGFLTAEMNPQLSGVRKVYFLTMSNAMDQYLANRIAQSGLVEVVTDPQKADAIFTDTVGAPFEKRWDELYPPPPPPEPPKKDKDKDKDKDTDKDKSDDDTNSAREKEKAMAQARFSGFRRGKGTVFLVSRASREVVWSIYMPPKSTTPRGVEKASEQIAKRFRDDRAGK